MATLIGYDITDTDKDGNPTAPQPVYFNSKTNEITCEAREYYFDIAEGEMYESVDEFVEQATKEGWFKKK